jgi:hypothetical protein
MGRIRDWGTHDNTCKGHKYKNKDEVSLRDCEVRGSEGLGDTVTGQNARNKDKLWIGERG